MSRAIYLVVVASFFMPFVMVKGCSDQKGPSYTGFELILEEAGGLLAGVLVAAVLLFVLSFRQRSQAASHLGFVHAAKALLCALAGMTAVFAAEMTFLFSEVSWRIGLFVCVCSWAVVYLLSLFAATRCVVEARRASHSRPPRWGLAFGLLAVFGALATAWLSEPAGPVELLLGLLEGALVAAPLLLMVLLAAARRPPRPVMEVAPAGEFPRNHAAKGNMRGPKSRLIPALCIITCLTATTGLGVAFVGTVYAPSPLPLIDDASERTVALDEGRLILETAQTWQSSNAILRFFYKDWLLESELEELEEYEQPRFEGDSFVRRVAGFNATTTLITESYQGSMFALVLLSSCALVLSAFMLAAPGYLNSVLLAASPFGVAFIAATLDINHHPFEYCLFPFMVIGVLVFLLQLRFSFKFGRPEHRTVEGLPGLMIYRRGLVMATLGTFLVVGALLVAGGSISGSSRSARSMLGQMVFGEDGLVLIGLIAGVGMTVPGLYYLSRKPTDDVD